MKSLLLLLTLLLSLPSLASETSVASVNLKPLTVDNIATLEGQHQGSRYAVIFWSLTCVPCRGELEALGAEKGVNKLALSLVNTGDDNAAQLTQFLQANKLAELDNWVFAEPIAARLRQAIDDDWFGELPWSYAVDEHGTRFVHAGRTDIDALTRWLANGHG